MQLGIRNQIEGTVTGILRTPVLAEVQVETEAGLLASVTPTRAVDEMELRVGDRVVLRIRAVDVEVEKP